MPPGSGQKGTGKKGGAASAMARQRSRNTTPSSVPPGASLPPIESVAAEYLDLSFDVFRNISYEDLVDSGASNAVIPDSRTLDGIVARLQRLQEIVERRGSFCDRGMRLLAENRKNRMTEIAVQREREEERHRKEAEDEERERRANKKKRKATENLAPPAEGNTGQSGRILAFLSRVGLRTGSWVPLFSFSIFGCFAFPLLFACFLCILYLLSHRRASHPPHPTLNGRHLSQLSLTCH